MGSASGQLIKSHGRVQCFGKCAAAHGRPCSLEVLWWELSAFFPTEPITELSAFFLMNPLQSICYSVFLVTFIGIDSITQLHWSLKTFNVQSKLFSPWLEAFAACPIWQSPWVAVSTSDVIGWGVKQKLNTVWLPAYFRTELLVSGLKQHRNSSWKCHWAVHPWMALDAQWGRLCWRCYCRLQALNLCSYLFSLKILAWNI